MSYTNPGPRPIRVLAHREIAMPIHIETDGSVAVQTSDAARAGQHIRTIVLTQVGERVMRPTFGMSMAALFDSADPSLLDEWKEEIRQVIAREEPEVRLTRVDMTISVNAPSEINVEIDYVVPLATGFYTTTMTLSTITAEVSL